MISHRVQKRLTHEVHEALALRDKRGQSKHKDKQAARKAAQDNHTAYKTITGLFSICFLFFCKATTAKAAEKEAKRQAVIFENEVKQGRAALDARTKLSDVAREYIRNTEMEYKTKEWYEYMLRVVEDDIGNMPISALKAYQIERMRKASFPRGTAVCKYPAGAI